MSGRAVVSWIRILTDRPCEAAPGSIDGVPVRCAMLATWEEDAARGPDGRLIDMGRPRLRCDGHLPKSTNEVEHRKESW